MITLRSLLLQQMELTGLYNGGLPFKILTRSRCVTHMHSMVWHKNHQTPQNLQFLTFVDENSQPNGRSTGAQFWFSPKFTRIGEPTNSERITEEKASHSLLCEFNQSQTSKVKRAVQKQGKENCSECSAFRWLKEDRPKHGICPHKMDYCDRSK